MPDLRKLAVALLCALPLAAAGCGGSSDDGSPATATGGTGEELYRQYACASCHSLDGDDGTGPTFQGLAGSTVTLEGGERLEADRAYLEQSITDPDAQVREGYNAGLMTSSIDGYDLESKPEDVAKLVEFIQYVV
jgi:cytochrome c oxidase subunit 2